MKSNDINIAQANILIVDDTPEDLHLLSQIVAQTGYQVRAVTSESWALAAIQSAPPDLILLDITLPAMNSYDVCRRLKEDEQTRAIPIIFISALDALSDRAKIFAAGGADYIIKPYQAKEVLARIKLHLSRRDGREQLQATDRELQQNQLMTAIEQMDESIVITDTEATILYVNPAFEQITGYSRAEVIGQSPTILKSGKHDANFYKNMWGAISEGKVWRGRFINKKKDGELYTEDAIISPVRDERGTITNYIAIKRDVTLELQLENQYRQAQKMESVGRLAGGVAHDFNNLLTSIMGHAALALDLLPSDASSRSDIEIIQQNAERAASLTRQLLAFARHQVIEPRVLNLNEVILNIEKMLRRLIGEDIELVVLTAPDLNWIKADPGQIEQVLLNLAINARDAMLKGGKLLIETANITLDKTNVRQHAGVAPGKFVLLSVSDNGVGMTEDVREHIFEPFFTTKKEGHGTGLGLATCFGIIKQNKGHIWCDSEPGKGTTFRIYLPCVQDSAKIPARQGDSYVLPRGTETILLAEDDASVRYLAVRVLREQGYNVLEASNGYEALALIQEQGRQIQLLLTDVVMPGISGKMLAEQLEAVYPEARTLFISGYTDSMIARHNLLEPNRHLLQKPFTPSKLTQKVRQTLDDNQVDDCMIPKV